MRSVFVGVQRNIQAILAFSLLAFQVLIPWTVPDFVTADGPSHLYNAVVARNLLFHPHSEFAKVYSLNHYVVPNWGTTVVLGAISAIAGARHAEQIFASFAIGAGFFAFAYAIDTIAPGTNRWTPITNFLLQSWFLWVGYDNFYLGMVVCPLLIGYYIRHASSFTAKNVALLAAGMSALFFTHLIPAVLVGITIVLTAIWVNVAAPFMLSSERPRRQLMVSRVLRVGLSFVPVLILFAMFARGSHIDFKPRLAWALENFPMHVFVTSSGRAGDQSLLCPAVLCLIVLALFMMRRTEWQTARGGLAISTVSVFLLYLLVPDLGLGGKEAKIRFAWGVFVLGGLLLATVQRMRPVRLPFGIYAFALLLGTLASTQATLRNYSVAVETYLTATKVIPKGARLVRLRYPTPDVPEHYGFLEIGRDPLFHLDSYVAAQCECLDLTDYQAPNNIFPVVFSQDFPHDQRWALWSFEGPTPDADQMLKWLESTLPVPIDYVILVADRSTPGVDGTAFHALLKQITSEMQPVGTSSQDTFVRVYRRTVR
jgi:hypothetical protein